MSRMSEARFLLLLFGMNNPERPRNEYNHFGHEKILGLGVRPEAATFEAPHVQWDTREYDPSGLIVSPGRLIYRFTILANEKAIEVSSLC